MAERRPLVVADGVVKELSDDDTLLIAAIKKVLATATQFGINTQGIVPVAQIDIRGEGDLLNLSNTNDQDLKINISNAGAVTKKAQITTSTNTIIGIGLQGSDAIRINPGNNVEIVNGLPGVPSTAAKTAEENVYYSTTLQNDEHLFLPVLANSKYLVELYLVGYIDTSTANIGLKLNLDMPTGSTLSNYKVIESFGEYADGSLRTATTTFSNNQELWKSAITAYVLRYALWNVLLTTGTTAGSLTLQWAQYSLAAVSRTYLTQGSYLRLTKVA